MPRRTKRAGHREKNDKGRRGVSPPTFVYEGIVPCVLFLNEFHGFLGFCGRYLDEIATFCQVGHVDHRLCRRSHRFSREVVYAEFKLAFRHALHMENTVRIAGRYSLSVVLCYAGSRIVREIGLERVVAHELFDRHRVTVVFVQSQLHDRTKTCGTIHHLFHNVVFGR